ncbi:hypothetical protein K9M74_04840 [Candidatus Woesearchaeota archaeon]|nr:hypothetical protein [Candidatus Woesearchaeota archaeon]
MKYFMLSLKDEYFQRMVDGSKLFEFRRVFASSLQESFVGVIYVSSPVQAVKGLVHFKKPLKGSVDKILNVARDSNYPFVDAIKNYFGTRSTGYALPVERVVVFDTPIPLKVLRQIHAGFQPPQSFYCLENEQFLKLRNYVVDYGSFDEINK